MFRRTGAPLFALLSVLFSFFFNSNHHLLTSAKSRIITSNSFWTTSESQMDPEEEEDGDGEEETRRRCEGWDVDGVDGKKFRSVVIVPVGRRGIEEGRHADDDADPAQGAGICIEREEQRMVSAREGKGKREIEPTGEDEENEKKRKSNDTCFTLSSFLDDLNDAETPPQQSALVNAAQA